MIFLGVCKNLEMSTGIDAWIWRLLFIIFGCSFIGIVVYIVLSIIL